jgi:hypothetical protein
MAHGFSQFKLVGVQKSADPSGASTSKGTAAAEQTELDEDETGGDEDLELAWEVAETARIGMEHNQGGPDVDAQQITETYQLLGDIGSERELFPEAILDYEKVKSLRSLCTDMCAAVVGKGNHAIRILRTR